MVEYEGGKAVFISKLCLKQPVNVGDGIYVRHWAVVVVPLTTNAHNNQIQKIQRGKPLIGSELEGINDSLLLQTGKDGRSPWSWKKRTDISVEEGPLNFNDPKAIHDFYGATELSNTEIRAKGS